jgi:hypothetical protein
MSMEKCIQNTRRSLANIMSASKGHIGAFILAPSVPGSDTPWLVVISGPTEKKLRGQVSRWFSTISIGASKSQLEKLSCGKVHLHNKKLIFIADKVGSLKPKVKSPGIIKKQLTAMSRESGLGLLKKAQVKANIEDDTPHIEDLTSEEGTELTFEDVADMLSESGAEPSDAREILEVFMQTRQDLATLEVAMNEVTSALSDQQPLDFDDLEDLWEEVGEEIADPDVLEAASREEIRWLTGEEREEKTKKMLILEKVIFHQVQEAADRWWERCGDRPEPLPEEAVLEEVKRQRELMAGVADSTEYLLQLYYDAAKAQKRLTSIAKALADSSEGQFKALMPSIKGLAAAWAKADKAGGDSAQLRDLARGTIEVDRFDRIIPGTNAFLEKAAEAVPGVKVTRLKNKFDPKVKKADDGYADIQLHLRVDGGHICEMQVQCTALLDFKDMGAPHRPSSGAADESWDTLIPRADLEAMQAELGELDGSPLMEALGEVPKDARHSLDLIASCAAGRWNISSHVLYNISRWLEKQRKSDKIPLSEVQVESVKTLEATLMRISKAGAAAAKARIRDTIGPDVYDAALAKLQKYDRPDLPAAVR